MTAPGSFQSELGCPGDWDPGCLRSWLQDPDGDGRYTMSTTALPPGSYEVKAAINQSWDENYGAGRRAERREHRVLGRARRLDGRVLLRRLDARAHRLGDAAGRRGARRQRRVGRPAPRLARPPLPHPRRRGAGRDAGEAPPAHVPRRRHERAGARVRRQRERAAAADDAARGRGRVLLPGRPRQSDVRLLRGRAPERLGEQPLVPVRRLGRDRHGLLRRQHGRARRRPRRHHRRRRRPQLGPDGVRARLPRAGLGAGRGHLPDLPGPLQERATRRTTRRSGRSATARSPRRRRRGTTSRGLLPQLRHARAVRRRARTAATTSAATSRASGRSSTTCRSSASPRSTSTRSSRRTRTTATTPPTTRRSTRGSATRRSSSSS